MRKVIKTVGKGAKKGRATELKMGINRLQTEKMIQIGEILIKSGNK